MSILQKVSSAVNRREKEIDGGKVFGKAGFQVQVLNLPPVTQQNSINDATVRPEEGEDDDQVPKEFRLDDFLPDQDKHVSASASRRGTAKRNDDRPMRFVLIQRPKNNHNKAWEAAGTEAFNDFFKGWHHTTV